MTALKHNISSLTVGTMSNLITVYYFCLLEKQQENLEMAIKNGKHRLIGFVDLGEGHDLMRSLSGTYYFQLVNSVKEKFTQEL